MGTMPARGGLGRNGRLLLGGVLGLTLIGPPAYAQSGAGPVPTTTTTSATTTSTATSTATSSSVTTPAAVTPCRKPAPTTASGWQRAFTALDADWAGGDQASSLRLPDQRILWLFGDTVQASIRPDGSYGEPPRLISNSLVIADHGCLTPVTGANHGAAIPDPGPRDSYWPQHGLLDGGHLYLFAAGVHRDGRGAFAFHGTGMDLAEFALADGAAPTFLRMYATPASGTSETQPQWGAAVAQDGGFTYVYGTQKVNRPDVFGKALYAARVPAGHLTDLKAWRFWNGRAWVASASAATVIRPAAPRGVSTALTVHRSADSTWVAITKENDFLGQRLVALTSRTPVGPWTSSTIGQAPSGKDNGQLAYLALAHAEIPLASGRLLITVSRNNIDPPAVLADANEYKPQFREVARS